MNKVNNVMQRRHYVMVAECFGAYLAVSDSLHDDVVRLEAMIFARILARRNGNCNFDRFVEHVMKSYEEERNK